MRRLALVTGTALGTLAVADPAEAFFHNAVTNPYLHAVLDGLTLACVVAPLWTAFLWAANRRGLLVTLVTVVQVPVAIAGFVPIIDPVVHLVAASTALAVTVASLVWVRRVTRECTDSEAAADAT
jgi:hypothetical protein